MPNKPILIEITLVYLGRLSNVLFNFVFKIRKGEKLNGSRNSSLKKLCRFCHFHYPQS